LIAVAAVAESPFTKVKMPSLWNIRSQPRRVFGWTETLQTWTNSLTMPPYVQTIVDNLRAASNPDSDAYDFPLEHFTNFLNNEQDGLKWFLYEVIAMRWMWGETRLDYVRHLVDEIENLDSFFPSFPGSPNQTIRQFLENNLNNDEREYVNLPAPSEPEPVAEPEVNHAPINTPSYTNFFKYPPAHLRLIRPDKGGQEDDMISIYKTSAGFNLVYQDKFDDLKTYTRDLSAAEVIRRIRIALRMVALDEDPFESVQLQLPNLPSVLYHTASLTSQTRDLVYDAIESILEEWPSTR